LTAEREMTKIFSVSFLAVILDLGIDIEISRQEKGWYKIYFEDLGIFISVPVLMDSGLSYRSGLRLRYFKKSWL